MWHEFQEGDCPFGLLFNERINAPCFYTLNENSSARIWPTICDDTPFLSSSHEKNLGILGQDFVLAQKNGKIQLIQYEGVTNLSIQTQIWNDVVDMSTCEDLCYRSIENDKVPPSRTSHEEGDSVEILPVHRGEINETQRMAVTDQTLRLGDYLFDELNTEEFNRRSDGYGPDLRIVQLYKTSIRILAKTCPDPFIPEDFRNRILSGFLFLVQDTGIGEVDDISAEEFEEIMAALRSCENMNPTFRLEGTVCSMKTIASEIIKILPDGEELETSFRPVDWDKSITAFPYRHYDPFAEFAWQAVTVVHGTCFATFKPNANMHHKYTASMEKLFGDKIRFRWENPTQLEDSRMWGTWFLADLDTTYMNFGACMSGAYEGAPFAMKLDRPIDKLRKSGGRRSQRQRRDAEQAPSNDDATYIPIGSHVENKLTKITATEMDDGTVSTENDTDDDAIQSYWKYYRSTGGVTEKLKGDVQCFHSAEKRSLVLEELKESMCTSRREDLLITNDEKR
ncbi:uncharacterized protein LOC110846736 isoform X1 [Folsomia candida]|nr:uncharacterized protein LOC110846736 isoform X1 [Folsomia candida]